jgi:hypothetical protein
MNSESELGTGYIENAERLDHDFWTDPVSSEDGYLITAWCARHE